MAVVVCRDHRGMLTSNTTPTGETGSAGPPRPPSSPSRRTLVRQILSRHRADLSDLETLQAEHAAYAARVGEQVARCRAGVVALEALLSEIPLEALLQLHDVQVGGDARVRLHP